MKQLEKGQDKIQKIAEDLRLKTLEPAKQEALQIIQDAKQEAERIVQKAEKHAQEIISSAHQSIEQDKSVFHSSMIQASKQSLEALKQSIEKELFSNELKKLIDKATADPNLITNTIQTLLKAIEKEGLETELSVLIPKTVTAEKINALLGEEILKKLKEKSVVLGDFDGGAQVKLHDMHLTLDMSDKPLRDLLANYCRKDFRKLFFQAG